MTSKHILLAIITLWLCKCLVSMQGNLSFDGNMPLGNTLVWITMAPHERRLKSIWLLLSQLVQANNKNIQSSALVYPFEGNLPMDTVTMSLKQAKIPGIEIRWFCPQRISLTCYISLTSEIKKEIKGKRVIHICFCFAVISLLQIILFFDDTISPSIF